MMLKFSTLIKDSRVVSDNMTIFRGHPDNCFAFWTLTACSLLTEGSAKISDKVQHVQGDEYGIFHKMQY